MTTIWLARHAETSAPTVFHGAESDIGLSELGRRQAAAAAGWFAPLGVTAVVSSGMLRARDTAAPVAAASGVPHSIEPHLHERRVGAMSGTSFSSEDGPWPQTIDRWEAGDTAFSTPGAESFDDLRRRLVPAIERVAAAHPGGRVVVVAHGVVCKVLLLCLLPGHGPGVWKQLGRVANLSVSELTRTGEGWSAAGLLQVPPPVAALTDGAPTGVGEKSQG
ncbi:histidine phosphatase family protein [Urbifossiella limnaea]|uniref:Glucosyl-3-phosphoglycerate phosphatase n=1 Tax=Urbifossiella limnaea TaxID=2528023 RepID=A0A517XVR5_9BACT|nr:histidine phosphatase family protein [Urbifossiella limnaea]QDU21600.1 Glucosyl-3-phosphoglycerate phosphatase [Urbifossiella limnaea]